MSNKSLWIVGSILVVLVCSALWWFYTATDFGVESAAVTVERNKGYVVVKVRP